MSSSGRCELSRTEQGDVFGAEYCLEEANGASEQNGGVKVRGEALFGGTVLMVWMEWVGLSSTVARWWSVPWERMFGCGCT